MKALGWLNWRKSDAGSVAHVVDAAVADAAVADAASVSKFTGPGHISLLTVES